MTPVSVSYCKNAPGRAWKVRFRRGVVAAVCSVLRQNVEHITAVLAVVCVVTPPQTTLRLVSSALAVITVRRHLYRYVIVHELMYTDALSHYQ